MDSKENNRAEEKKPDDSSPSNEEGKSSSPEEMRVKPQQQEKPAASLEKKPQPKKKSPVEIPQEKYRVSSSPHIFGKDTVPKIMWTVNICLAPAGLASIYIFGLRAFFIIFLSLFGAVASEALWQHFSGRKITIADGSAFLTGLLLAYNLPPTVDWWIPLLGSAFAIIVAKQFFGGLGMNIFNPALAARGFLLASWPSEMTAWAKPVLGFSIDLTTQATPLDLLKRSGENPELLEQFKSIFPTTGEMFKSLLMGARGGCIGETCAILLILGGIYLIAKKYIDWQIPVVYIGTVIVFSLIAGAGRGHLDGVQTIIFSTFSGGLILGAFYMATDYVTTPATVKGRIIFALCCGILTGIIRMWGGYPEGVCYSILIMNAFTPLIDDKTRPMPYGVKKESKAS